MSYHFSKILKSDFESSIEKIKDGLKKEGFGVVTEIDMKETFKNKLGTEFRKYTILGACNPQFALRALEAEDKIGTMLPCNVVVQDLGNGSVEISAVDPVASMIAIKNGKLADVASEVQLRLKKVINNL